MSASSAGQGAYRAFLSQPDVPALLAAGALARLPLQMFPLAMLLLVLRLTGSAPAAGMVAGVAALGLAAAMPVLGRAVDRLGPVRPLRLAAVANVVAFAGVLVAALTRAPVAVLALGALAVAVTLPPVTVVQRSLWPVVLSEPGDQRLAVSIDAQLLDAAMVLGPLLVAALVAVADPILSLAIAGLAVQAGTWWFSALRACRARSAAPRPARTRPDRWGALQVPAVGVLVLASALTGATLAVLRVTFGDIGNAAGSPAVAGVALAAFAAGSVGGGTIYGTRAWGDPSARRLVVLLAGYAVGLSTLLAAAGPVSLTVLCLVAGLGLGPVVACTFELVARCVSGRFLAEGYAWMVTATFLGAAAGSPVAGALLAAPGADAAFAAAAGCTAFAAAVVLLGRSALEPRPEPNTEELS